MFAKSILSSYTGKILGVGLLLLFGVVWETAATYEWMNPLFISSPSRIFQTGLNLINDGSLWDHFLASSQVFLWGYLLSVATGVFVGIILGSSRLANEVFDPVISALYCTPRIALMPLFIIWFGLGITSKIVVVFLSAVFPIIINMQAALRTLDKSLLRVADSYGASSWQIFWTIALPASVPFLFTGLRLASGRALLGVVAAELFGGSQGIGYLIAYAGTTFQTDKIFVGVLVVAVVGVLLDKLLFTLGSRFEAWRGRHS